MGIPPVNFSSSSLVTPLLVYTCVLAYMFFFDRQQVVIFLWPP